MNKLVIVCLACIALVFAGQTVYAGNATAFQMNIDAYIQENGDMDVVQDVLFDIDGNLNGVFLDILTKNFADQMQVLDIMVEDNKYSLVASASNGQNGVYTLSKSNNGYTIKIYSPSVNEIKNVQITYRLTNVVTKYTDVAELYWNYIGTGWQSDLGQVSLKVHLPQESNDIRVWGHGPLNGVSKILDKKTVALDIPNVRAGQAVDVRLVFDNEVVPLSQKENNIVMLDEIIEEETRFANEANALRKKATTFIAVTLSYFVVAYIVKIVIWCMLKKYAKKPQFNGVYYRELPEDYGPATVAYLMGNNNTMANGSHIMGTLLNLIRKKYISVEEYDSMLSKDYRIKLLKPLGEPSENEDIDDIERYVIDNILLFENNETTLKKIKKHCRWNAEIVNENYKELLGVIREKAEQAQLFAAEKGNTTVSEQYKKTKKVLTINTVLFYIISILIIIYSAFVQSGEVISIFIVAISGYTMTCGLIYGAVANEKKITQKGVEHKAMWKAFKKFLEHFSMLGEHPVESIVIWEHYLVYAASLGVAKKVIKQLKDVAPEIYQQAMANQTTSMAVMNLCANSNAFNSFNTSISPASNGSGGGGGFSGGGGGGRRRRRWRWLLKPRLLAL